MSCCGGSGYETIVYGYGTRAFAPIKTDEICYSGPNLPSSGINTNDGLTQALQKIDDKISSTSIYNAFMLAIQTNVAFKNALCAALAGCP